MNTDIEAAAEECRAALRDMLLPQLADWHAGLHPRTWMRPGGIRTNVYASFRDLVSGGSATVSFDITDDRAGGLAITCWFSGYGVREGNPLNVRGVAPADVRAHAERAVSKVIEWVGATRHDPWGRV